MEKNDELEKQKDALVRKLENQGRIKSSKVKNSFLNVPRERFVPESQKENAYKDIPLNIGKGQTISAPHIVAIMTELLDLSEDQKVLEIGTGSGYHAAITAEIAKKVYSIEIYEEILEKAKKTLNQLNYDNISVQKGDGSVGLPKYSPYDRIYFTCSAPEIKKVVIEQLSDPGKMVAPIGRGNNQKLYLIKKKDSKVKKEPKMNVRFVPLRGEEGF